MEDPHGCVYVNFCPFCGHDLSLPAYASLEEALASLLKGPPLDLVFDVDGVLCDDSDQSLDYLDRPPYPWVSETLKALKAAGHTIRIQTARYMKKFDGDQNKARDYGRFDLVCWLRANNIPYDGVYMGKASGHIYFDDRGGRVESSGGTTQWCKSVFPLLAATQLKKSCPTTPTAATAATATKSSSP